jgi:hypothetical protein
MIFRHLSFTGCTLLAWAPPALAQSAYVRVNQVGYEAGSPPFRAYLMSTAAETGATFNVLNSSGQSVYSAPVVGPPGTWRNSSTLTYSVYALNFTVPAIDLTSTSFLMW